MAQAVASLQDITDGCLQHALSYLPGRFRFIAGVDRRFRRLYLSDDETTPPGATTFVNTVESISTAQLWLTERDPTDEDGKTRCVCAAIRTDALEALAWLLQPSHTPQITFESYAGIVCAASWGQLRIVQWFRSRDPTCKINEQACTMAAEQGHVHVIEWLRSQDPPFPWSPFTCSVAAAHGRLDVIHYLRSQDPPCPWNEHACNWAAAGGHTHVVEWLRSQDPPCPWDASACTNAVQNNRMDVLQWLRSLDPPCPWDFTACYVAAASGRLELLQWLRAQDPPCPWNYALCLQGSQGNAEMTQWLQEQQQHDVMDE